MASSGFTDEARRRLNETWADNSGRSKVTAEANHEAQSVFVEFSDLLYKMASLHSRRRKSEAITDSDVHQAFSDIVTPALAPAWLTIASNILLFVGGIFGGLVSFHWSFMLTGLLCGAFGATLPWIARKGT